MKGVGSYNDWPYYASPSSNLSAFAAPFSVNRSFSDVVSAPFVNSSASSDSSVEPSIQFSLHSRSYGYDFFSDPVRELDSTPSSKPYGYSGFLESSSSQLPPRFNTLVPSMDSFSYDQNPNSSKPSVAEAQPYYPSYVPPTVHDPAYSVASTEHWPSSSGFAALEGSSAGDYAKSPDLVGFTGQRGSIWNQFVELNQGKSVLVGAGSSFSANQTNFSGSAVEERNDQGRQDEQDSNNGVVSHMIGWEKHRKADQLDDKSLWWGLSKPVPTEFPGSSVMAPSSVSLDSNGSDPFKVHDSGNRLLSYISSYDRYLKEHDELLRGDKVCSTPTNTELNIGNIVTDRDLGKKIIFNCKGDFQWPNPGTAGCFGISHLYMHPEINEPSSSNNAMASDENVSADVVDYVFKEIRGFQDSHANLDNLSLRLGSNGNVNSVEKSIDGADRCNPALDSPCWKGSPAAQLSRYQIPEDLPPEYLHKNEKCFGSAFQEPLSFLNNTTEIKENNVPSSKPYDCETGYSYSEHVAGENKLLQKPHISLADGAGAGSNMNNDLECGESQMAEVENSLSSSSVEDGPTTLENSAEKVSSSKFIVQTLVERMQNLSEMLLMQLSNDACEFKEQDSTALKNVISNLSSCVSKNAGQITPSREPQPEKPRSLGQSCKHQLKASFEDQQVSQVEPENSKVEHENPLVKDAKNLPFKISPSCDAEMEHEDNMTKAIKRILSENFLDDGGLESQGVLYKNLWLEAEAELCSIKYKARYYKMKIEMEKNKQKGMEQSCLSKSQSSATKVPTDPNPDMLFTLLDSALNSHADMRISFDVNQPNAFTPEGKSSQDMETFNKYSTVCESDTQNEAGDDETNSTVSESDTEKEAGDGEASVMERFHLLKARGDKSCMNTVNVEELSETAANSPQREGESQNQVNICHGSIVSESDREKEDGDDKASVIGRFHVLKARGDKSFMNTVNMEEPSDTAANSPHKESEGQNQVNICHYSPTPCRVENKVNDYEASVITRFHILKSRDEDSSSVCSEYKFWDAFDGIGAEEATVTTTALEECHILDVNLTPSEMYFSSYSAVDKSIPKDLHVDLEDHEEIEPCSQFEDQHATYYSDGLSLDWEHIEKRSL